MPGKKPEKTNSHSKLASLLQENLSKSKISEAATRELEEHAQRVPSGSLMRQIILGGQDGVVNVLGIALGVASATNDPKLVLVSGLAGTFAESISMAAVAYTSSRAMQDHYAGEVEREKWEIEHFPEIEAEEIRIIYMKKGFRGKTLEDIVKKITSNKKKWLEAMMSDELGLGSELKKIDPNREAAIVGFASLGGSLIPIIPFLFLGVQPAMAASVLISVATLFAAGFQKAKKTIGDPLKSGLEMAVVGTVAALAGYLIGSTIGAVV